MDLVVKARGDRITGRTRDVLQRKIGRLSRFDGHLDRVEVEVIRETRGRIGGGHRVEASARSGRRTYRASASGQDVESAVDRVVDRLERQITEGRRRRRSRLLTWASRVKSRGTASAPPEPE
ncbi:MAG TPA: ribosome-associated translation inhibitor RaiA [Actinomycetota bacterium]|jgi:ribosomal subunit interface protein|nr:ribosome-associated translation inhibitor RaiA [Actinomycetota bacterium]